MDNYFCIIGAQRSGTTYLYRTLDKHPDVEMAKPLRPEPKFFLKDEYKKGKIFYLNKYFSEKIITKKIIGEKSTSYMEFDLSERILSLFPDAKILVMLRNPVDRAISNYFFSYSNGLENRSLSEVFLQKKPAPKLVKKTISVSPFDYIERGHYLNYLKPYLNAFGRNMKVIVYERFMNNRREIEKVYNFLGLNESVKVEGLDRNYNGEEYDQTAELKKVQRFLKKHFKEEVIRIESLIDARIPQWK